MACNGTVRAATCVAAAALAGVSLAAFPPAGRADDGLAVTPVPSPTAAVDPVDLTAAVEADAEALAEEISTALEGGEDAEAPVQAVPESAPATGESGPEAAPDPGTTTAEAPAPDSDADTTADQSDTGADTTASPAATAEGESTGASPSPVTVQASPANLNVSVRIDSPGDDGPVTQVNVAAAVVPGPGALPSAEAPPGGAGSSTDRAGQAADATGADRGLVSGSQQGGEEWKWEWDCLSTPTFGAISQTGSTGSSIPSNWTWIWNCAENQEQYRGATVGQYQPVNVNVSIRVASPGNNGGVTQSNVAIAIGAAREGASAESPSPPPAPAPVSATGPAAPSSFPGLPVLPLLSEVPELALAPALDERGDLLGPGAGGMAFVGADEPLELSHLWRGVARSPWVVPGAFAATPRRGGDALPGGWFWPIARPSIDPAALRSGLPAGAPGGGAGTTAEQARRGVGAQERVERAPRWRTPVPTAPASETAPLGTSAAAASGGGSSGAGLPVFLALPFLAALLDLARRVALERVTLPSGHRGHARDDPG